MRKTNTGTHRMVKAVNCQWDVSISGDRSLPDKQQLFFTGFEVFPWVEEDRHR